MAGDDVDLKLYGRDEVSPHRRLDLVLMPCNPKNSTEWNKNPDEKECLADLTNSTTAREKLKATIEYLKEPDLVFFINSQRPDFNNFGEDSIIKETVGFNR